jgi:hypothetical protein
VPVEFGVALITNDLVWWVPFAMILWAAAKNAHASDEPPEPLGDVLGEMQTSAGATLLGRSRESADGAARACPPFGVHVLQGSARRPRGRAQRIESAGVRPVIVHMGPPGSLDRLLTGHGLEGVETVSDPERRLYRALEIPRGTFAQLFGPTVWVRGVMATLRGHAVGRLEGDGFQMPGTVVLRDGKVLARHDHETAADRADFAGLACGLPDAQNRAAVAPAAG